MEDTELETKNDKGIQSVNRAIQILNCFENNEELGVTEISKLMSLHKSTAFGLISTLEMNKLLEKNEVTGKYRLGIELFRLGTKVNSNLRKITVPYLEKLVNKYQETVNLVVMDNLSVVYLEKVEGGHSMRTSTAAGKRFPLNCTGVGKSILAGISEEELKDKLIRMTFTKFTDKTICDRDEFTKCLDKVRKNGYAEDFEELEIGLVCVAAPIYNHLGSAFAAISVSGPKFRMNQNLRKEISESLVEYTQEISKKLGYTGS
mgnify:CR=1 FL=1